MYAMRTGPPASESTGRHGNGAGVPARMVEFLRKWMGQFVALGNVYLYEQTLLPHERTAFLPCLDEYELKIIRSDDEADRLARDGYEDFRNLAQNVRERLEKGAVAFCVYVEREFAHVGWIAQDRPSKESFDRLAYHVAFEDREACAGGVYTAPKFRGKGLNAYGWYERFEYLRTHGYTTSRYTVGVRNEASQRGVAKFGPSIYGKARYIRVLRWWWWKERPVDPAHPDSRVVSPK